MMKSYRYIIGIIGAFAILSFSACSNDDYLSSGNGKNVSVTFLPRLDDKLNTRAIGDATGIDQLTVAVYEGSETLSKAFSFSQDWDIAQRNGVTLTLIEGRSYKILFWAENKNNSVYDLTDDGRISVDYTNNINGGFAMMEEMDAFYGISEVTVASQKVEDKGTVTLSRPLAQLNFADKAIQPTQGIHKAIVTFHSIPSSFNPFTCEVVMTDADNDSDDVIFTFTDFPTNETLMLNETPYYYVSSNYLFAPSIGTTSVSVTLDLQFNDGTSINKFEFKGENVITLEQNKKTNVLGAIVQQPETWSVWDGTIPAESTLTLDPKNHNRYIIDAASDIAWLSVEANAGSLETDKTFILTADIDMSNKDGLSSIQLPRGSTLDGDKHTIKGLSLDGGLLGNVTNISVQNLTIKESTISNTNTSSTHIGVLANTLSGSAAFINVTIKNSTVSTNNGAAGGIVGYISRKEIDNRTETLEVTFDNCHVVETSINGSQSGGHFVGLLRGYDNGEILEFKPNCTSQSVTSNFVSPYTEGNEGAWLASKDYSKYNGWLGNEECYRGMVYYGDKTDETNRFIPCWDGFTKIAPLKDGTTQLIYSAFDLASLQGGSHTAVVFKEDVDLGGDRTDNKNPFTPIAAIETLDGENHKIYNLNIYHKDWIVGFIDGTGKNGSTHKNIHFINPSVRADMAGDETTVYVGTLCPYVQTEYVVKNITVTNGYVLGLNKIGGLIGFVTSEDEASLNCTNCKVVSTTIENIESSTIDRFGNNYVYADFYPHGESGGFIGFIANDAEIVDCSVNDCDINCYGQDMKKTNILNFKVPGRHVNRFIGDIRTVNGDVITINDCSADNNRFGTRKEDTQYSDFQLVGRCYYIEIGMNLFGNKVGVFDTKGKLIIDGTEYTPSKNNGNLKI